MKSGWALGHANRTAIQGTYDRDERTD